MAVLVPLATNAPVPLMICEMVNVKFLARSMPPLKLAQLTLCELRLVIAFVVS